VIFRQITHDDLGCASYLIGDDDAGVAARIAARASSGLSNRSLTSRSIINVTATDKGTGKEQKIEIQSGSGLSDEEIQNMVSDAESHAEEDAKQRELAEARNLAENAAYQSEKALEDAGDKVDEATVDEVKAAVKALRDSLESGSVEEINAKTEALTAAMQKASEQIYAAAEAEQAASADGASSEGGDSADAEEVVDAEVVDEDGK